jgi:hypothetical protein
MAIYYAAVEGDPLDSGEGSYIYGTKKTIGTVEDKNGTHRNMVFIGDEGYCAKCDSSGPITYGAGVSERRRMVDLVNGGRLQAVGGDIVLCKCGTPPRIIAVHGQRFSIEDGGTAKAATGTKAERTNSVPYAAYDEQVTAIGRGASEGYPYCIEAADGRIESGRLDSSGVLPRIYTDNADAYAIHWGDEALSHGGWGNAK